LPSCEATELAPVDSVWITDRLKIRSLTVARRFRRHARVTNSGYGGREAFPSACEGEELTTCGQRERVLMAVARLFRWHARVTNSG